MIGRDYKGPNKDILNVSASNIPQQTKSDLKWAGKRMQQELPSFLGDDWDATIQSCKKPGKWYDTSFPKSWMAYQLRNDLKGLVIGPTDKNKGELWLCCPCLYRKAWANMYSEATGYVKTRVSKWTKNNKKLEDDELRHKMIQKQIPLATGRCRGSRSSISTETRARGPKPGGERDLVNFWEHVYKKNDWNRFAKYDKRGGLNLPYLLFKHKNVVDPEVRKKKWMSARPIAPGTKHPMRKLFHLAGRAWSFIATELGEDNFIIPHGGKVTQFLEEAQQLSALGTLAYEIKDVKDCYPKMPKEIIRFAMRNMTKEIEKTKGYEAVDVPSRKSDQCVWKKNRKTAKFRVTMPIQDLLNIMEFALDNAFVKDFDGNIWRQVEGIPMGDPHSPGMTIITCAWMEREWLANLDADAKRHFRAKRFMDDILLFYAKNAKWDHEKFVKDFCESECYVKPLCLEDGKKGTFLETRFEIENGKTVKHWLKNDNEDGTKKIWRYTHFHSHGSFAQKRALLTACLKKVQYMASGRHEFLRSASAKVDEFVAQQYPLSVIKGVCTFLGATTGDGAWISVRNTIRNKH